MCVFAAYDIANVTIDGFDVVVNKPSTAAYRAPGATNAAFATETVVDEIAEKLAMDPIEFRLRNAAKEGTRRADGPKYRRIGCVEVLEAMKTASALQRAARRAQSRPRRGRRLLVQRRAALQLQHQRECRWHREPGGRLDRHRRHAHLHRHAGGGSARHRRPRMCTRRWSIPIRSATPAVTGGSRTTFATGWAAYEAAQDVMRQMKERAAKLWEADAGVGYRGSAACSAPATSRSPSANWPRVSVRPAVRWWAAAR